MKKRNQKLYQTTRFVAGCLLMLSAKTNFAQYTVTTSGSTSANYIPVSNTGGTSPTLKNSDIYNDPLLNSLGFIGIGANAGSPLSGEYLSVHKDYNGGIFQRVYNNSTGTSAYSGVTVTSGLAAPHSLAMYALSQNYSITTGLNGPSRSLLTCNSPYGLNIGISSTSSTADLRFFTNNQQKMVILNNGNVGVGTTAPATLLEVNQTGGSAFRVYANTSGDIQSTASMRPHFASNTDFTIYEGTPGSGIRRFKIAGTTGQAYIGTQSNTVHTGAMLHVNGDVVVGTNSSANIWVTQSTWADYVFDRNYELMNLGDLEKFYKENHHLPNVPTAKEIQEKGNNLGQTDAVLLQKIEELTLYVVELKKEIEAIKKKQ